MATTNDYQKLIDDLDGMKDYCEEMSRAEPRAIWKPHIEMLQEAMDIISDYERMAESTSRMVQHYETKDKAVSRNGILCCPACGKKIAYHHSHCHWCGKKIGWENERR